MKGQALVELALAAPVMLVLALGAVTVVQVFEGDSGLQAATSAAVSAATRAPDGRSAVAAAESTFVSVIANYRLRAATLTLADSGFARGAMLTADSTAFVDVATGAVALHAEAMLTVEPWRSRP